MRLGHLSSTTPCSGGSNDLLEIEDYHDQPRSSPRMGFDHKGVGVQALACRERTHYHPKGCTLALLRMGFDHEGVGIQALACGKGTILVFGTGFPNKGCQRTHGVVNGF